jgi:hypothetical protein
MAPALLEIFVRTAKNVPTKHHKFKRSAPVLCLLRSRLRRNVDPLEDKCRIIRRVIAPSWERSKGRRTIQFDNTLPGVWVVTNVHSGMFFGVVGTHAHLAASRLSAKTNGFREWCEVLSRDSFMLRDDIRQC